MTVLIVRVDATHETGLGHAIRTSKLLDCLPVRPKIHVLGGGDPLKSLFPKDCIYSLEAAAGPTALALIQETGAEAILVDEAQTDADLWTCLDKAPDVQRILIDDFGSDCAADLVFNGTVIETYHHYPNLREQGRAFCGGEYALLAPHFAMNRRDDEKRGPIVAVCGSGERAAEWAFSLAEHGPKIAEPHRFLLIVGDGFPEFDALRQMAVYNGGIIKKGLPSYEMAAHMTRAPVVITTGGMSAYEAMASGAPALAFPQLENLKPEIAWFAERDGLIDLGFDTGDSINHVAKQVRALVADDDKRALLSKTGPELVDGQGMTRAAQILAETLRLTAPGPG